MIFMLAPAPNMAFGPMPSGSSYQANQYGLIFTSSTADQVALMQAGCETLTPFGQYSIPPGSAWKLAATGCSISGAATLNGATYLNKSCMSVLYRTAIFQLSGVVKLLYNNWVSQAGAGNYWDTGTTGFGTITGTCSISYPGKNNVIGTGSFTVQPGQTATVLMSLSTTIPAGAPFWVSTYAVPALGCGIPMLTTPYSEGLNSSALADNNYLAGEGAVFATSGVTDQTASPGSVASSASTPVWGPSAVISPQPASTPVVMVCGDSREDNYYYLTDTIGNIGWFAHAMGDNIATLCCSVGGQSAAALAGTIITPCPQSGQSAMLLTLQFAQLCGVTDLVLDLGINDMGDLGSISGAATAATVEGYWSTIIGRATAAGLRVTGCTLMPITSSTDGWVTTANQSLSPNNAQMDIFNTYVRGKPVGVTFVIDAGAAVGTGLSSAKWNVGAGGAASWTFDGVHPYDRALGNLIGAVNLANYANLLPATAMGYADTYGRGLPSVQTAIDFILNPENLGHEILLGSLIGANFNSTADQAIALNGPSAFVITSIVVCNPSQSLSAAQGGFYAAASKTAPLLGTTTTTAFSALTNSPPVLGFVQAINFGLSATGGAISYKMAGALSIYLSLTSAQGSATTGDVYVFGRRLTT